MNLPKLSEEHQKLVNAAVAEAQEGGVTPEQLIEGMLTKLIVGSDPEVIAFRTAVMLTILAEHLSLRQISEAWMHSGFATKVFKQCRSELNEKVAEVAAVMATPPQGGVC